MQPRQLIWLGVGNAKDPSIDVEGFDICIFIDARSEVLERLKVNYGNRPNFHYVNCSISAKKNEVFNVLSIAELSRLGDCSHILNRFPNMEITKKIEVKCLDLEEVLNTYCCGSNINTLIVDIPVSLNSLFIKLDALEKRCNVEWLILAEGFDQNDIVTEYERSNYRFANTLIGKNGFKYHQYYLVPRNTSTAGKSKKEDLSTIEPKISESLTAISQIREKCLIEHDTAEQLASLETSVNHILSIVKGLPFKINKAAYNSSKQVEAFLSLDKYLSIHEVPLNFHGWPISPDIGLILVDHIENYGIDAVIEFGSGTSTVLLSRAYALANKDKKKWPLDKPIISIEHSEKYLKKTWELLENHGCKDYVSLNHCPLAEFQDPEGENYLYYQCGDVLKLLADDLQGGKKRKILVLVDGPPGSTNRNARYPALSFLLNHLGTHMLTIVMDDYNRDDERDTFEQWEQILIRRNINYRKEVIESEKGLSILYINCDLRSN